MTDEDLLKCPLLQGLDAMHRAELIGLLKDSNVLEKLEQCLAEHLRATEAKQPVACGAESRPQDFQKQVHSWKPDVPTFTRSPKE